MHSLHKPNLPVSIKRLLLIPQALARVDVDTRVTKSCKGQDHNHSYTHMRNNVLTTRLKLYKCTTFRQRLFTEIKLTIYVFHDSS